MWKTRQTRKLMTFIFKNLKFKSLTIKQSVTYAINTNKSVNQGGDNGNYRLVIGDKNGWQKLMQSTSI